MGKMVKGAKEVRGRLRGILRGSNAGKERLPRREVAEAELGRTPLPLPGTGQLTPSRLHGTTTLKHVVSF